MITFNRLSSTAVWLLFALQPGNAADFALKDGDRVVMIGDSITEQHLHSSYVEAWTLTRFPAWDVKFVNSGIGGDTGPGGNNRFKRDVLPYGPTAMTVNFGMNDAGGPGNNWNEERFKNYMKGMQGIADQAKAAGIRVTWLTPQPVEVQAEGPSILPDNLNLEKFSAGVKEIAATNGNALFVDQFHPFAAVVDKARAASPKNRIGGGDPVHPGPPGQSLMAASILKGMGFPTSVAAVEIDASARKLVKSGNCTVDGLKVGADGKIEFQQKDKALPFFPEEAKSILAWAPILEEMNDYRLKVTGLKAGQYELRLGGVKVGDYTAEVLNTGVNIAPAVLAAGPIADQVKAVWAAVRAKNQYFHDKIFHGVLRAGGIPDFLEITPEMLEAKRAEAFKKRMAMMPELFDAIRKALVMQAHAVEIVPSVKP
ncbi:MAG: SGNH/GDSL hydrolase family protein [Chthoniobacter sp.]|nr:SGNH/GDSL hydrolase family protein [Chthoniobacter sp.]